MEEDIEVMTVHITKPNYKNLYLVNTYKAPHINTLTYLEKLTEIIELLDRDKGELWILGDTNIDMRMSNEPNARNLIDFCRETGVKHQHNDLTRPNPENCNKGTCIDHIMTECNIVSHSRALT